MSFVVAPTNVLIAMDGSEDSDYAFNWYIQNFHKPDNNVTVIHCPEYRRFTHTSFLTCDTNLVSNMISEEENKIKLVLAKINEQLKRAEIYGKIVRQNGNPGDVIVKAADSHGVDLIVIGSRGLGKLRRTLIGSTSDFVLHHSSVPVLIIRKESTVSKT